MLMNGLEWIAQTSSEPVSSTIWDSGELSPNSATENCVNAGLLGWNDQVCDVTLMFYSYRIWNVMTEKKTCQEAFDYFQTNNKTLASSATADQLLAEKVVTQNQTIWFWTRLQFLNESIKSWWSS